MNKYILSIFFIFCFFCFQTVRSQNIFSITQCNDSSEVIALIDSVLLGNVDSEFKKNLSFTGDPKAVGFYIGGELFGFIETAGIIMSTGFSSTIDNSNDCSSSNADGNTSGGADSDLSQMASSSIYDACVIEFDIQLLNDTVLLNYMFGSEEYHDYVNLFIDRFGFFLSGPGINGPYSNNAKNIAVVPGTSADVSLNSVNCGNHAPGCDVSLIGGPNCNLLFDNTNSSQSSFSECVFDAYTYPLKTNQKILSNDWHHFKIAIGDAVDAIFDSGILLEKGSFISIYTSNRNFTFKDCIELKPNPAREYFKIYNSGNDRILELKFYDLNGKLLRNQKFENGKISLADLPQGMLILEIISEKNRAQFKIIHQ